MSRDRRSTENGTSDSASPTGSTPGKQTLIERGASDPGPRAVQGAGTAGKQTLVERIAPDPKQIGKQLPSADGADGADDGVDGSEGGARAERAGANEAGATTAAGGEHAAGGERASAAASAQSAEPAASEGVEPGGAGPAMSSALVAAASAGPATSDTGLVINRKAASEGSTEGTIEGQQAGAVVGRAQEKSTGAPLPAGVRAEMEAGFDTDLSAVRVHTGGDAADAARGVNARAFAVGHDIYFDQGAYDPGSAEGKHLLAHELAHVVQGGGRPAAKASGGGMSVSSPGDAHEVEADAAATAVVGGGKVGLLGSAAPGIHRDALGDLDATSRGNWVGNVDEGEAIRRVGALTDPEKRRFATEESFRATIRRLVGAFDAGEMVRFFSAAVHFEVRWKIYWLIQSGAIDELDQAQWRRVIGIASPADMDELRRYETGYRAFVVNGPNDLVPPWDRLQALKRGWWTGDPARIRLAVNSLSAAQRATIRDDAALTRAIVTGAGTGPETFRVVTYLNLPLKWAVHWLDQAHKLAELTPQNWSQLLGEAPKAEFDELVGWVAMWQLAQRHCPPAILQVVRQNTNDPNAITTQLQDPVALGLLWTGLGAAGLLGLVTQAGTDVAANYGYLKASGKHLDVLNGLERGMRQGERTSANLKKWFDPATGESVISTLELMASVRFNTTVGGTGGAGLAAPGGVHAGATLAPWTAEGLRKAWQIMERVPPAMVESNPAFLHLLRNSASNGGYYAGTDTSAGWDNSSVIGLQGASTALMSSKAIYGGTMPKFNQTLRHEIGHAVDNQLTIMAAVQSEPWAGAWENHGNPTAWIDAMIAAGGGLNGHGYPASDVGDYRAAMIRAATNGTLFLTELNAIRAAKSPPLPAVATAPTKGPVSVLNDLNTWHHGSSFWGQNVWKPQNDRNFVRGYGDGNHWWSFANAKLAQKATDYQFRAPKEWFADAYAVYYAEQETNPDVPVGGLLRSKDPAAADFIAAQVDRSYSPQLMAGGATRAAPGTPGGVGGAP